MSTVLIHLLTSFAFCAHALLGCCGHHFHDSHLGGSKEIDCQQSGKHLATVKSVDHHGNRSQNEDFTACHHHSGSPCNRSQRCDEGRCVFVNPRLIATQVDFRSTGVVSNDFDTVIEIPRLALTVDSVSRVTFSFIAARSRCAMLQRWLL